MPRALKDANECAKRRELLNREHIAPLVAHAKSLARYSDYIAYKNAKDFFIPTFDPLDGGINAKILFILEKPGPKTRYSEFISRDNDDQTAENTLSFMNSVRIPREWTCLWNLVPIWNGTRKIQPDEIQIGREALLELVRCLPKLNSIVFVGKRAHDAIMQDSSYRKQLYNNDVSTLNKMLFSPHPSPIVYATNRPKWESIKDVWRKAYIHALVDGDLKQANEIESQLTINS